MRPTRGEGTTHRDKGMTHQSAKKTYRDGETTHPYAKKIYRHDGTTDQCA